MEYMLVLQLPGSSQRDYEELLALEDAVCKAIGSKGAVDGHDIGSGERNIFLFTEDPRAAFEAIRSVFSSRGVVANLKAGYREVGGDDYTPLFPDDLDSFSVI